MSTATSALLVAVAAAACGPDVNSKAYWLQTNVTVHDLREKQCNEGDNNECYYLARDYLLEYPTNPHHKDWVDQRYPLDRVKAKQLLERVCDSGKGEASGACHSLVTHKMYTTDEMVAHCKTNEAMCEAAAFDESLTGDQRYEMVMAHQSEANCQLAVIHIDDAGKRGEAFVVCDVADVEREVEKQARLADYADNDDDSPSSDSACHKDTDCKGDRICQGGNCVDAKAPAPAKEQAKPAEGPLHQPECDALVNLRATRISKCAKVTQSFMDTWFKDIADEWSKVPKDRYEAVGARCSAATTKIESLLDKLHC